MHFGMPTLIECPSLEQNLSLCSSMGLDFVELNMNLPEYQLDQIDMDVAVEYDEIGCRIIEKEQMGEKRAQYGKRILQGLSAYLTDTLVKGFSTDPKENTKKAETSYLIQQKRRPSLPSI